MSVLVPTISAADEIAVGASSATFGLAMTTIGVLGQALYRFVSTTNCWLAQSATPTATSGAGSLFVPANTIVILDGSLGTHAACIQDSTGGKASLCPVLDVR